MPINVGQDKPSFELKSEKAFAWNNKHSEILKAKWSKSRGIYKFYLYNNNYKFVQAFDSGAMLSLFFSNVSKSFGSNLAKMIISSSSPGIRYGQYIMTMLEMTEENLEAIFEDLPIKPVVVPRHWKSGLSITIYGYNPRTEESKV